MELFNRIICYFLISLLSKAKATDYVVIADRESFFVPCSRADGVGNLPLQQIIDISGLKYTYADDMETVYTDGDIIFKANLPKLQPIKVKFDLQRFMSGKWVPTAATMSRDDLCRSLFDRREIWYFLTKSIPKAQRICPPLLGTKYTITNTTNRLYIKNLPSTDIEGKYKVIVRAAVGSYTSCAAAYVEFYQV